MQYKRWIKPTLLIVFILIALVIGQFVLFEDYLNRDRVQSFFKEQGAYAPLIFIGIHIIATIFFVPSTALALISGFLFGTLFGALYALVGSLMGAVVSFLVARTLGKEFIDKFVEKHYKKLEKFDLALEKEGFKTVLILRLIPIIPFDIINYLLGVTRISTKDFLFATFLGSIPHALIVAYLANSTGDLGNPLIYIAFVLMLALCFAPQLYKQVLHLIEQIKAKHLKKKE